MSGKEIDEISGVDTTGHEWDGIKELNNPLPRWWLWTFYATIAFAIGYMIWYPAVPLINAATPGISGETNRLALRRELAAVETSRRDLAARLGQMDLAAVRQDDELYRFAKAGGGSLFKIYCSQCHGSGAAGGPGYPNLNDDDWLWGGDVETIYATIVHGVRSGDPDGRESEMPAFGDGILERPDILAVSEYVVSLTGGDVDKSLAEAGRTVFADNCAACHGDDGRGNRELGAPDLADAIWLYGSGRDKIAAQVSHPRHGVMPAWAGVLRDENIRQLAIYVHSLGGGE
ncbi:MAG: cytochrome-c oxidase, cbb3-type subunit III [Flavobacteriaceae bacterium]